MKPTRRQTLKLAAAAGVGLTSGATRLFAQQNAEVQPTVEAGVSWFDVSEWSIEGKGWNETLKPFDRLPSKAEALVPKPVWNLSRNSSGMKTNFATNSTEIRVRYQLSSDRLAMPHMPATGVSGVDLYAADSDGSQRWLNVSRPTNTQVNSTLAKGIDAIDGGEARVFSLYLPLYNSVEKLEIGVTEKSVFNPILSRQRPLLFYGTSIMHGACASRPGMSISAILGRRFNLPVTNLGFSGNGRMEIELANLIGELSVSVFAIDCLPNMTPKLVKERAVPFLRRLRELQPETPILLVEDREFTNARFFKSKRSFHDANHAELRNAFQQLTEDGVKGLHYLDASNLLGDDGDGATDGSHPNDLGMMRYADAYEKVLKEMI